MTAIRHDVEYRLGILQDDIYSLGFYDGKGDTENSSYFNIMALESLAHLRETLIPVDAFYEVHYNGTCVASFVSWDEASAYVDECINTDGVLESLTGLPIYETTGWMIEPPDLQIIRVERHLLYPYVD